LTVDTARKRTKNVAVLTDRPAHLAQLGAALRRFAASDIESMRVWVNVERFRAPSSTPVPYRTLARIEARNITAERLAAAEASATEAAGSWSTSAVVRIEAIAGADAEAIVERMTRCEVDLLACDAASGVVGLAERVAALTGRPVLLISDDEPRLSPAQHRTNAAARLLRAFHG
jgi:hypothetical protein